MNNLFLSILLITSALILVNISIYAFNQRKITGSISFSILLIAMAFHTLGYSFELFGDNVLTMFNCIRFEYLGASFYPFLIILFVRNYADEKKFAHKYILIFMFTLNIFTLILVNTNPYHHIFYSSISIDSSLGFNTLVLEKGLWYFIQIIALCIANIYAIITFIFKFKNLNGDYKTKSFFMLMGVSIPLITFFIYFLGLGPAHIDLMPFSYMIMAIFTSIGLFMHEILFLTPVTHQMAFDAIDEAVLITDKRGFILSFNNSSKIFFPSLFNIKAGENITSITEVNFIELTSDKSILNINNKYYQFKITTLDQNRGYIYVVSDVTNSENIKKKLEFLATTDSLTNLFNRRYFLNQITDSNKNGVFVIFDIDNFKKINDTFGHSEGDRVLSFFGKEFKNFFKHHLTCRYGGEEFALFMTSVSLDDAYIKVDSFRKLIEKSDFDIKFTLSAGLSNFDRISLSQTISDADEKLYIAKSNGRNQVVF